MTMYKILHKYYEDCFTNGEFDREKVLNNDLINRSIDSEYRLSLLESIYKIVLGADFNNDMSLYYLTHSSKTFNDCVSEHNRLNNDNLNIKTGRSRIIYCSRKINEIFEELEYDGTTICMVEWLFKDNCFRGLELKESKVELRDLFLSQLNRFNDLYGEKLSIGRKELVISLPSCKKVSELSEERFNEFMDIIRPYSREYMRHVQEEVNSMIEEVGYIKYLLSPKSELTNEDKERRSIILRWLGKPDMYETTVSSTNNDENIIDKNDIESLNNDNVIDDNDVIF